MGNSRTIISSSIVSIIIVAVGLFLLCVRRAPRINTDETTFGNAEYNTQTASDEEQQLLNLLSEASDEMALEEQQTQPREANQASTDDDLTSLLNEGESAFDDPEYASGEEQSMNDIMKLLEMEDSDDAVSGQPTDQSQDEIYQSSLPEFSRNEKQSSNTNTTNQDGSSSIDNLIDEVGKLENVLADKQSEKQQLQAEIESYDRQIAELESQIANPSQANFQTRQASNYESGSYDETGQQNLYLNTRAMSGSDYEVAYNESLQLFYERRYEQAVNQFYKLLQLNPMHTLADNCQYWIGECRYAQRKYYQAIAEFTKVGAYDAADKKDDAQLMIGLAFMKLGESQHAQSEFDWLISTFANSEYISKAHYYLNQF